jgi:hypothetical protein
MGSPAEQKLPRGLGAEQKERSSTAIPVAA